MIHLTSINTPRRFALSSIHGFELRRCYALESRYARQILRAGEGRPVQRRVARGQLYFIAYPGGVGDAGGGERGARLGSR